MKPSEIVNMVTNQIEAIVRTEVDEFLAKNPGATMIELKLDYEPGREWRPRMIEMADGFMDKLMIQQAAENAAEKYGEELGLKY